ATQFAKLSGLYVLPTASQRNFGLVRSLRADVVADYTDPVAAGEAYLRGRAKLGARS
ncbi:hypothetical protein EDB92DRAFT_1789675, partial [Lactarius akahatsu]